MASDDSQYHDPKEVEGALEELVTREKGRLKAIAVARLGVEQDQVRFGHTWADLLQEAIQRTLSGKRSWRRRVELIYHLDQTMKSIVSSWAKSAVRVSRAPSGVAVNPAPSAPEGPTPEQKARPQQVEDDRLKELGAKQRVDELKAYFADDRVAWEVLQADSLGMTGPEICEVLDITDNERRNAIRRAQRRLLGYSLDEDNPS